MVTDDELIADLEEQIKTKKFFINDAKYTLEHAPDEIRSLENRIAEIKGKVR